MRRSRLAWGGLGVLVAVALAADLSLGYVQSHTLSSQLRATRLLVSRDASLGLASQDARQLQERLSTIDVSSWWDPAFLAQGQSQALGEVRAEARHLFRLALERDRAAAHATLETYLNYVSSNSAWLSDPPNAKTLTSQLESASTPGALLALEAQLDLKMQQARSAVKSAQARAAATVSLAQAPGGLLQQASELVAIASADNLSSLGVPADAAALKAALATGATGGSQSAALTATLTALRAEIGLNDQVASLNHSVMDLVDQAAAEQTPGSSGYLSQYQAEQPVFTAAETAAQLVAVQTTLNSLQSAAQQSLSADSCGHTSLPGKSIYISLSLQEMVFYDNGCAVNATPVTTGRPLLRTPTGTFHIFDKQSPYVFISPWPPGSPFWYPTSPVNWVMEFAQGGYYIHDAPWEPTDQYGPGSENQIPAASHGCVQTPGAVMAWAYSWTPMGTPVVITN